MPNIKYYETDEDIKLTFDIFAYLLHCDEEANHLYSFYKNLFQHGSVRSILQATINNLKSKDIEGNTTKSALQQLYLKLDEIMGLTMGNLLRAFSDTKTVKSMTKKEHVFITRNATGRGKAGKCSQM